MYAYISGTIAQISPAFAVIDNNGIGYYIHISLHTFGKIQSQKKVKLYIHHYIRDESLPLLYGFADELEKNLFLQFTSVSGVGPSTAIMILSSYSPAEIQRAVADGNVQLLKSIKGIGPKSAQRIVLELKDKMAKNMGTEGLAISTPQHNTLVDEALSALLTLGIARNMAQKSINRVLKANPEIDTIEVLVKTCLKNL